MGKVYFKRIKKFIPLIFGVAVLSVFGVTLAIHNDWTVFNNLFKTKPYQNTAIEEFVSPTDWKTCEETTKEATITNDNNFPIYVRQTYHDFWRNQANTAMLSPTFLDENDQVQSYAIINFNTQNLNDWELKSDGWYYLKTPLAAHATSSSIFESVTFNCDANFSGGDNVCHDTPNGQVCDMTSNAYEGSKYHIEITFQTYADCTEANPDDCWQEDHTKYYNVSVNPNGGEYNGSSETWSDQVKWGTTIDLSNISWDAHHAFRGWAVNDNPHFTGQSYTITEDTTIIANWVYDGSTEYVVTVDPNGGEYNGSSAITTYNVHANDAYIIQPDVRAGYEVAYWLRDNTTQVRENYIIVNGDTTIKAMWANARNERTQKLYATVAEAMAEVRNGDTVTVLHDHESTFTNTRQNITLDLGGYTVTGAMTNAQNASITLLDGEINNPNGVAATNYGTMVLGVEDENPDHTAHIDNNYIRLIGSTIGLDQQGILDWWDGFTEGEIAFVGSHRHTPMYHDTFDDRDVYYHPVVTHNYIKDCQHAQLGSSDNAITKTIVGGEIYYYNLQDNILTSTLNGWTIYAIDDFDATYALNVAQYKPHTETPTEAINFDLAGFDVNFAENASVYGTFNIFDSKYNTADPASLTTQQSIITNAIGTLTMTNINVTSANANPILANNGTATLTNTTFTAGGTTNTGSLTLVNSSINEIATNDTNTITMDSTSSINGNVNITSPSTQQNASTTITGGTINGNIAAGRLIANSVAINGHITVRAQGVVDSDREIHFTGTTTLTSDSATAINCSQTCTIILDDTSSISVSTPSSGTTATYAIHCTVFCDVTLNDDSAISSSAANNVAVYGIKTDTYLNLAMHNNSTLSSISTETTGYNAYGVYCKSPSSSNKCTITLDGDSAITATTNATSSSRTAYGIYEETGDSIGGAITLSDDASVTSSGVNQSYGIQHVGNLTMSDNSSVTATANNAIGIKNNNYSYTKYYINLEDSCSITATSGSNAAIGISSYTHADINIDGCTITANSNSSYAYGISTSDYSTRDMNNTITMTSGTIAAHSESGNYAQGIDGAARTTNNSSSGSYYYYYNRTYVDITGGTISGTTNTTSTTAYGIGINAQNITVAGATIEGTNRGISAYGNQNYPASLTISDSTISSTGIGVYQTVYSTSTLTDTTVTGGNNGMTLANNSSTTITDSEITGTTAYGIEMNSNCTGLIKEESTITGATNGINMGSGSITTIGENDGNVSITHPEISGGSYAVYGGNSVRFYDGLLKGGVNSAPEGLIATVADATQIHSERINDIENTWLIADKEYLLLNGVRYRSLTDAYDNAASGDTIYVIDDFSTSAALPTNPSGKTITIDLNGHVLTYTNSLPNNGTMNIVDSDPDNTGRATLNGPTSGTPVITNSGTLNIYGGTIKGANNRTIQNNSSSAYVYLYGGKVTGRYTGIYSGNVTLDGGHIEISGSGYPLYGITGAARVYIRNNSHINVTSTSTNSAASAYGIANVSNVYSLTDNASVNVSATAGAAYGITTTTSMVTSYIKDYSTITVTNTGGSATGVVNNMDGTWNYPTNVTGHATITVTASGVAIGLEKSLMNVSDNATITVTSTGSDAYGLKGTSSTSAIVSSDAAISVNASGTAYGMGGYGKLTVNNSASISAHSTSGDSYGFSSDTKASDGALLMYNGSITAQSDSQSATSYGVYTYGATVQNGTISGDTYGIYSRVNDTTFYTVTLGQNDSTVSITRPEIYGGTYGLYGSNLYFYDGVMKGGTNAYTDLHELKAIPDGKNPHTERRGNTEDCWLANASEYLMTNGVRYSSLTDAYANVSDGGTIYVVEDYATEAILPASPSDKTITFDLQGHTLSYKHKMTLYGNFTITDTPTAKTGLITNIDTTENAISNYGNLTVNGARISSNRNTIYNASTLHVTNSVISSTLRGIYNSGAATIDGNSEINVTADGRNGTVYGVYNANDSGYPFSSLTIGGNTAVTVTKDNVSSNLYGVYGLSLALTDNANITVRNTTNATTVGFSGNNLTMDGYSSISAISNTVSLGGATGASANGTVTLSGHASITATGSAGATGLSSMGNISIADNVSITATATNTDSSYSSSRATRAIGASHSNSFEMRGNITISATATHTTSGNSSVYGVDLNQASGTQIIDGNITISARNTSTASSDSSADIAYGLYIDNGVQIGNSVNIEAYANSSRTARKPQAFGVYSGNWSIGGTTTISDTTITATSNGTAYGIYGTGQFDLNNADIDANSTNLAYGVYCTSSSSCSDITVIDGSIYGTTNAIYLPDNKVILGSDDGTATRAPLVMSDSYPINSDSITFYDGKLAGGISAYYTYPDKIKEIADNYTLYIGQETIDGNQYEVSYLIPIHEVARIGNTPYTSLKDAITAVTANQTILLVDTNYIFEDITIPSGKTFTIETDGNNIVSSHPILNQGNVTIENNNSSLNPTLYYHYVDSYYITNDTGASLTLNGVKLNADKAIDNQGTLTLTNTTINDGVTYTSSSVAYITINNDGGTIIADGTTIRSSGTAISSNNAATVRNNSNIYGYKYALYAEDGSLTVNHSSVSTEASAKNDSRYAIYTTSGNTITTTANNSSSVTGMVYISDTSTLNANTVSFSGAPSWTTTNNSTVYDYLIQNNGTLLADTITVTVLDFPSSTTLPDVRGGGIKTTNSATIDNSTISGGKSPASTYGYAILATNTDTSTMTNTTVSTEMRNVGTLTSSGNTFYGFSNVGTITSNQDTVQGTFKQPSESQSSAVATLTSITVNSSTVGVSNAGAGNITIISGTISVNGDTVRGIENTGSGGITLGVPEDTSSSCYGQQCADVSISSPSITAIGTTSGIGAYNADSATGRINLYDGIITGSSQAMNMAPNNAEYMYRTYDDTDINGYYYRILVYGRPD